MKFASTRLIAADIAAVVDFYETLTATKADWLAPVFAEIVLGGGLIAIGGAQTVALFREGSAQPAANRTAILEFLVEDVDAEFARLKGLVEVVQARHGEPENARALLAMRCLIGPERVDVLTRMLADDGAVLDRDHLALACDGDPAQFSALCAGLGVAAVQVPLALRQGNLRRVLPHIAHGMEVWLVTHPDLRASPAVAALVEGLAEQLGIYASLASGGLG